MGSFNWPCKILESPCITNVIKTLYKYYEIKKALGRNYTCIISFIIFKNFYIIRMVVKLEVGEGEGQIANR